MFKNIIILLSLVSISVFSTPIEKLKNSEKQITSILENKKINEKDKKEKIKNILETLIDYDTIAKNVLRGKNKNTKKTHYESITDKQREEFKKIYKNLLENLWRKNINKTKTEQKKLSNKKHNIKYKNEKVKGDVAMVYTVVKIDDELTSVDFRFFKEKIIDFIIDERSTVRRYRRTFSRHINNKGFDSLLNKLRKKAKELESKWIF